MSTEQITIRLPIAMVNALREDAASARRSLAAEVAWNLDQSPLGRALTRRARIQEAAPPVEDAQ